MDGSVAAAIAWLHRVLRPQTAPFGVRIGDVGTPAVHTVGGGWRGGWRLRWRARTPDRCRYCRAVPADATPHRPSPDITVEEASVVDDELLAAMRSLLPQLSSSADPIGRDELTDIVTSPASVLLVARQGGRVIGSLTLALFRVPTGVRAWIEDVVVDEAARGAGVGAALTMAAVDHARQAGARTVDLTSRPSREAANRLYQRLGFELRQTNVYRFDTTS